MDTQSSALTGAPFVAIIGDIMVNGLRAVEDELGERTLGRHLASVRDLREAIREGFRPTVVEELMRASGLTLAVRGVRVMPGATQLTRIPFEA